MIRTRFSPSPTGIIHLGNVRAALFSALYAAKEQGIFLLRIEDTDKERSKREFAEQLQHDLKWLGIEWQEGPVVGGPHPPYWQSERHDIYDAYYEKLSHHGHAYPCFCTDTELAINRKLQLARGQAPRYPGTCANLSKDVIHEKIRQGLKPALRFRVPKNTVISFTDFIKGPQSFNSDDIGDFIIRRAEGTASFMFCNAIDDSLMSVSHVLRGEDHLTNTPRQLLILSALNMHKPHYGHLSLILGQDGSPLSKRHGSFNLQDLRAQGYLPIAILNYMARLGHPYEMQELLSFEELANHFNPQKLSRSPAKFDIHQLNYWQKEAVMQLSDDDVLTWLADTRVNQLPELKRTSFIELARKNCLFPKEAMIWFDILLNNGLKFSEEAKSILASVEPRFFEIAIREIDNSNLDINVISQCIKIELNISGKKLFLPLRVALTGMQYGPELVTIVMLLGKEQVYNYFQQAKIYAGA